MRRFWTILIIAVISATGIPLAGQKIDRKSGDPSQIIHLRTALNHLTVIELREPVVQVATGSQSFKVEWRENKVFVQPTVADASTNLFIWTASERLNYELEPAGDVAAMDFAVDQMPLVQPKPTSVTPPPSPSPSPTEVLLAGTPVRLESRKPSRRPVQVMIRDLYEEEGCVLVRYAARNRSDHVYDLTTPRVYELAGVDYPEPLTPLVNSQLGDREAARVTATEETPIPVLESHVKKQLLAPGQESLGVVAVHLRSRTEPTILRFEFPKDDKEQVAVLLVR
jgi:RES domain-containing protein